MSAVVAIAKNLNLHYQGDRLDGTVQTRLLISESHLTWERLCKLSVVYGPARRKPWSPLRSSRSIRRKQSCYKPRRTCVTRKRRHNKFR